jgi:Mlc titration factor MtfA (ptsG expression regulator)
MFTFFKRRRRERLRRLPPPSAWLNILQRNVPYYRRLPPEDKQELAGFIRIFLSEKRFDGCGGLEITDEIRVTIAAQACILLLHRETDVYPMLRTILVYPHAYVAPQPAHNPDGTVSDRGDARLGESWLRGPVVLSWDDVLQAANDVQDGHNVVFHEFAHQLDSETGSTDGAPVLPKRSMYIAWARVLGEEYAALLDALEHHRQTLVDEYGATSPAEFFAVVTECFFNKAALLKSKHPDLYGQLVLFYQQDPVSRPRSDNSSQFAQRGGDGL